MPSIFLVTLCRSVHYFREKVPLGSDNARLDSQWEYMRGSVRAQDAAVASQTPRHAPHLLRASTWIGASAVSSHEKTFSSNFAMWPPTESIVATAAAGAADAIKADSKQTHVADRVVRPVCPQMPVDRPPVPVFLTRFAVRCPFIRGIDMHNIVLESRNFCKSEIEFKPSFWRINNRCLNYIPVHDCKFQTCFVIIL